MVLAGGFRPKVAQAIVSLGVDLAGLQTAATFQGGIALAAKSASDRAPKDEPFDTAAPLSGIEGQATKDEGRRSAALAFVLRLLKGTQSNF